MVSRQAAAGKTETGAVISGKRPASAVRKLLPRPHPRCETSSSSESLLARLDQGSSTTHAPQGPDPSSSSTPPLEATTTAGTSLQSDENVKLKAFPTRNRKQEKEGGKTKRTKAEKVQVTEPPRYGTDYE